MENWRGLGEMEKSGRWHSMSPEDLRKMLLERRNEETRRIVENNRAVERDYRLRKAAQRRLAVNLSRISPASALTFGSMSLARTGVDESDRFLDSVRAYQPVFENWYNSKTLSPPRRGEKPGLRLNDMPRISIRPESLRDSLFRAIPDFVLMMAMIIVFFVGAYISFLRYDVR